ncbi:MAG: HDOD domain-containing protein [Spirochaetes bacterium]|nr:HDOD domain-containing protein [Spirochaetota bacterium]
MITTPDTSVLASDLLAGKAVAVTFKSTNEETFLTINSLIAKILSRCNLKFLIDTCITVVREIVLNAVKANAKRVFFKSSGLDIFNGKSYDRGMAGFRRVITDFQSLREDLTKSPLKITVRFTKNERFIVISVKNTAAMTDDEAARLLQRIDLGLRENDFNEIYEDAHDTAEGAGLGIIISLLLLKNAGLDPRQFRLHRDEQSTSVEFRVPMDPRKPTVESEIKLRIIDEIESLPTFPKHILELQGLCDNPKSNIDAISKKILSDPSLTADVLKISNSAGFISGKRIDNITDAIIIIGLRNLKSILIATATRRILDRRYKRYESIWDHCNKTAFYGRLIAEITGQPRLSEQVFIAGLLHDIGKIALLAADESLAGKIGMTAGRMRVGTTPVLEEVYIGISHTTIGRLVSEKWNFPEFISVAIEHHHTPLSAPEAQRGVVTIVYLANMLCEIEMKNFDMSFIETEILEDLGLRERVRFNEFFAAIQERYERHTSSLRGQ